MEILVELAKSDVADPYTGIIYPQEVLVKAVEDFEKRIRTNEGIMGEYTTPVEDEANYINFARVSHVVKHIWMKGNVVVAKLGLVGKYAEITKHGPSFGARMRSVMIIDEKTQVASECIIITVDLLYEEIPVED